MWNWDADTIIIRDGRLYDTMLTKTYPSLPWPLHHHPNFTSTPYLLFNQETFVSSSSSQSPSPHGGSAEVWATRWRLVPIVNTSTLHSTQHKLKHNADTSQVMKSARYIRNSCKILHDKIFPSLEIESGSYHTLTSLHQVRNTQLLNIQSGDVAAPSD